MRIAVLLSLVSLTLALPEKTTGQDEGEKDVGKKKDKRSFAYGYGDLGYAAAGGLSVLPAAHPHVHPWIPLARPAVAAVIPQPVFTRQVHVPVPVPVDRHVPVPHPVPYPVYRHVHVDRPVPVPVPVDRPVAVPVDRPVPVPVLRHVPVPVDRPVAVPVPVDRPYAVPVDRPVAVPVFRHVPVPVDRPVDRPFPVPVPVPQPVGFPVAAIPPQAAPEFPVAVPQPSSGFPVVIANNKPEGLIPPPERKPSGSLEQFTPQRFPPLENEGYDLSPPRQHKLVTHHHHYVRPTTIIRHSQTSSW